VVNIATKIFHLHSLGFLASRVRLRKFICSSQTYKARNCIAESISPS